MSGVNKPNSDNKPDQQEKRKKESILELSKFLEKSIRVKFAGGREASGVLKGTFHLYTSVSKKFLFRVATGALLAFKTWRGHIYYTV